ncbi:unnamed protein product, partial [Symbiodinium sp. KB8]
MSGALLAGCTSGGARRRPLPHTQTRLAAQLPSQGARRTCRATTVRAARPFGTARSQSEARPAPARRKGRSGRQSRSQLQRAASHSPPEPATTRRKGLAARPGAMDHVSDAFSEYSGEGLARGSTSVRSRQRGAQGGSEASGAWRRWRQRAQTPSDLDVPPECAARAAAASASQPSSADSLGPAWPPGVARGHLPSRRAGAGLPAGSARRVVGVSPRSPRDGPLLRPAHLLAACAVSPPAAAEKRGDRHSPVQPASPLGNATVSPELERALERRGSAAGGDAASARAPSGAGRGAPSQGSLRGSPAHSGMFTGVTGSPPMATPASAGSRSGVLTADNFDGVRQTWRDEGTSLRSRLVEMHRARVSLEQQLAEAQARLARVEAESQERISALTRDLNAERERLVSERRGWDKQTTEWQEEQTSFGQQLGEMRERCAEANRAKREAEAALATMQATLATRTEEASAQASTVSSLNERLEAARAQADSARAEAERREEGLRRAAATQKAELERQLEEARSATEDAETRLRR